MKNIQVFLRGGLGNQLFQYSTALWLARRYSKKLIIRSDLLPSSQDSIGGVSRWPCQLQDFSHSGNIQWNSHQPSGRTNLFGKWMQLLRMIGDWTPRMLMSLGVLASERPYSNFKLGSGIWIINSYAPHKRLAFENRNILRAQLNDLKSPSTQFVELDKELSGNDFVAIHIRLGDYMNFPEVFGSLDVEYFKRALEVSGTKLEHLVLFTDSPELIDSQITKALKPAKVIGPIELESPLENILLISRAKVIIASNSSFSWWASLISSPNTSVVAPHIKSAKVNNFSHDDAGCEGWKILETD